MYEKITTYQEVGTKSLLREKSSSWKKGKGGFTSEKGIFIRYGERVLLDGIPGVFTEIKVKNKQGKIVYGLEWTPDETRVKKNREIVRGIGIAESAKYIGHGLAQEAGEVGRDLKKSAKGVAKELKDSFKRLRLFK